MPAHLGLRRILVRAPNWIGDQVLAYPFFVELRRLFPQAEITVACVDWVKDLQFRNLIDDVFVLKRPLRPTLFSRFRSLNASAKDLKAQARARPFDLGISLPNSFSAAWLLYRAGAVMRRGYNTESRGFLLNDRRSWNPDPSRHRAQAYLDLLGTDTNAREFWSTHEFEPADAWPGVNALVPPSKPFAIIGPGATADARRWPTERFGELAGHVARRLNVDIAVVGGPSEAPLVSTIRDRSGVPVHDFTAKGPVTALWKLFRAARVTVTNESGLAHVAALCGSPVEIVCGAADPRRTQPLGPARVHVTVNPVECWPCERNSCWQTGAKTIQCLTGIHADAVMETIEVELNAEQTGGVV